MLSSLKLSLKKRNVATGETMPITMEDNVALIAGVPDTLFSQVRVWLNSSLISSSNAGMRNIYCHLSRLMSFQSPAFDTFLETEKFFKNDEREGNSMGLTHLRRASMWFDEEGQPKKKKRKTVAKRFFSEAFDVLEDIFD